MLDYDKYFESRNIKITHAELMEIKRQAEARMEPSLTLVSHFRGTFLGKKVIRAGADYVLFDHCEYCGNSEVS